MSRRRARERHAVTDSGEQGAEGAPGHRESSTTELLVELDTNLSVLGGHLADLEDVLVPGRRRRWPRRMSPAEADRLAALERSERAERVENEKRYGVTPSGERPIPVVTAVVDAKVILGVALGQLEARIWSDMLKACPVPAVELDHAARITRLQAAITEHLGDAHDLVKWAAEETRSALREVEAVLDRERTYQLGLCPHCHQDTLTVYHDRGIARCDNPGICRCGRDGCKQCRNHRPHVWSRAEWDQLAALIRARTPSDSSPLPRQRESSASQPPPSAPGPTTANSTPPASTSTAGPSTDSETSLSSPLPRAADSAVLDR